LPAWNAAARALLPAPLKSMEKAPPSGYVWEEFNPKHPLTAPISVWARSPDTDYAKPSRRPRAFRYWRVEPVKDAFVVAAFADGRKPPAPALVERSLDKGRVVQFTTALDRRPSGKDDWTNYYHESSFGLMLTQRVCAYLAGDAAGERLNFWCGDPVVLPLAAGAPRGVVYRLDAPDPNLTESEKSLTVGRTDESVEVRAAAAPGAYVLLDPARNRAAAFSLNVRPEEARLDRLPAGQVEKALGRGAALSGDASSLAERLRERDRVRAQRDTSSAPVDPLPLLMAALLVFLTAEGVLANRFYRRPAGDAAEGGQAPS
jgi:hypothetical protein